MPTKKTNRKRIAIWIGSFFLIVIVLLGIAAIYLSAKWKPILTTKIKEGVYEGSHHLYRLDFKDIHLNLVSGGIVLDSITLTPDTAVHKKLKDLRKAPAHLFKVRMAHLRLSRVGILTAYFKKKIKINGIVLDHPSIDMIYYKVPNKRDTTDEQTLYQQISKSLRSIRINSIRVIDADFDYYNGNKKLNAVKHLKIDVKDILIDSLSQFDTTRVFHAKNIGFELTGYKSATADKMYSLDIDTVRGAVSRKTLLVKGLRLKPLLPDLSFSRKYKTQKDRYDLTFKEIMVSGIDFISLNADGELHAKSLNLGPAKVAIFLNRQLPPPGFDKVRNYPHNALKRLPIPTVIDTLVLKNIDIAYTEFNPKTNERGTFRLENLKGDILNVTNDSARLQNHGHAYANLNAAIMGSANINVKINFNLVDKAASFTYQGHMGPMNLRVLNPLSRSLGLVAIEKGNVQSVDFDISANERGSSGTVKFVYNDLKINLLAENEDGNKEKKGLLSFLANTILIKNDNPSKGDPVRVSNITFTRVPQASFFNLMWKSVFVGIRETVGIGMVPMKPMEQPKKSRKEMRQERRAEKKKENAQKK